VTRAAFISLRVYGYGIRRKARRVSLLPSLPFPLERASLTLHGFYPACVIAHRRKI